MFRILDRATQTSLTCLSSYQWPLAFVLMLGLSLVAYPALAQEFFSTGTYTGDGTGDRAITGVGFEPDLVIIKSVHNKQAVIRTSNMPDGGSKMMADNKALELNRIHGFQADGFRIGHRAEVNGNSIEYHWVAMKAVPGQMVVGEYTGNGHFDRELSGFGFLPSAAFVISADDHEMVMRTIDMEIWEAYYLTDTSQASNTINAFDWDLMAIGSDDAVNQFGQTYYYVVWNDAPGYIQQGSYWGNDQDNRWIGGLSLEPEYLMVRSDTGLSPIHRPDTLEGDNSLYFDNSSSAGNRIQALTDGAFQVGNHDEINHTGLLYYWLAFAGNDNATDLQVSLSADGGVYETGDSVTYTLGITNAGPADAGQVQVTDTLPTGLTFESATPSQGTYNPSTGVWSVGNLADGAAATLSLVATVDANAYGRTLTNTIEITSADLDDPISANNQAQVDIWVTLADLMLNSFVNNDAPDEGETIVYTLALTNIGPDGATGVQVTDLLPGGVTYLGATPSQGTYNSVSGVWQVGVVDVAGTATLALAASVDVGTGGTTITNAAAITGADQGDSNALNNLSSRAIIVTSADLSVDVQVDQSAPDEGQTVTYSVTVDNAGPSAASGVVVTDLLPAGLTFLSATPDVGTYTQGTGVWLIGDLANAASVALTLSASVNGGTGGTSLTNTAAVTAMAQSDPVPANNSDSVSITVASTDLRISNTADLSSPNEGDPIDYTVTVYNDGPMDATGIQVTDVLPAGVSMTGAIASQGSYASGTGVWTVGDLTNGSQAVLTISATVNAGTVGTTLINTATITACDLPDPNADNNLASVETAVSGTDLSVQIVADTDAPNVGDTVTFTVTVTNVGPNPTGGIEITNGLPVGLTYASTISSQGSYNAGSHLWSVGTLDAAEAATLTLTATVDSDAGGLSLATTTQITDMALADPVLSNNTADVSLTVTEADLILTSLLDTSTPDVGQTLSVTVTLENDGPSVATGLGVTLSVPPGLTFASEASSQGAFSSATGLWSVGTLAVGVQATLVLGLTVDPGTAGQLLVGNAVVTSADQSDPNPTNNSTSESAVVRAADLRLAKAADLPEVFENSVVTYTLSLSNDGPDDATAVQVADTLPDGLDYVNSTASQGAYNATTGVWSLGDVSNGSAATLSLQARAQTGQGGEVLVNTASIAGADQGDPLSENNVDSANVAIIAADIWLVTAVDNDAPNEGDMLRFSVVVGNTGPSDATGLEVTDLLPAGLSFVSATPTQGTYADGTGLWDLGGLTTGASAELLIDATVDAGTVGQTLTNTATVVAADQPDPQLDNNTASVELAVSGTDLELSLDVDETSPLEGALVTYTLTIVNKGPNATTGIVVTDLLPAGLTFSAATPSLGVYDSVTGVWTIGNLANADKATLDLVASVDNGTGATTLTNIATITAMDLTDPIPANNTDSVDVTVSSADLAISNVVDDGLPEVGQAISYTVTVDNAGPSACTGIYLSADLPDEVVFQSSSPSQGIYSSETGQWFVGNLAPDAAATLVLHAIVGAEAVGFTIDFTAAVTASELADPDSDNNHAVAEITVLNAGPVESLRIRPLLGEAQTARPGQALQTVLQLEIINVGLQPDTLRALTLNNLTSAYGMVDIADLDAEWQALALSLLPRGLALSDTDEPAATQSFTGGQVVFENLDHALAPGDTLDVTVSGAPSLLVRDGARLKIGLDDATDLDVNAPLDYSGVWPLTSGHRLDVDGFVAAQATVQQIPADVLGVGSRRNPALIVDLPSNGYLVDTLYGLTLVNYGSALPGSDIQVMEAWADNGDGTFSATTDEALGEIVYSGDLWHMTGLSVNIPRGGRRIFFTVDIAETAQPARDIRLGLPVDYGPAVEMLSGNDGPMDVDLENNGALGISVTDRVILTADRIAAGEISPGQNDIALLRLNFTNTYAVDHQLQSLNVANAAEPSAPATMAQKDAMYQAVMLRYDGNGNGQIEDLVTDPALGSGAFIDGEITFTGLDLNLPNGQAVSLFVTADVSLTEVADGDHLSAIVTAAADVWVPNATTVATWPLDSGADWVVDGLVADQLTLADVSPMTLGPGDGPALALDLIVPSNGYQDDELLGLTVVNAGTAADSDLALLNVWTDDGNGIWDGPTGDDTHLGELVWNDGQWSSLLLSEPVPQDGLHLFVTLNVADPPTDGRTVQLSVPLDGLQLASGNSGPIDVPVIENNTLVLSTAAIFSSVSFEQAESSVGYTGQVVLTVRNMDDERVTGVTPNLNLRSGDATLDLGLSTPATMDLDPDAQASFSWTYTATGPGQVVLEGNAAGLGQDSGLTHTSATMPTPTHTVYTPVPRLDVYPVINLPASITRGVEGVVPMTLTLVNPGDEHVAVARLDSLSLRLAESVGGAAIVPSDLFTRVEVSEGTNVYHTSTSLPVSGDEIMLRFEPPVIVTGREPVTLSLRMDLYLNTTVPSFLISVDAPDFFHAIDAVNGQTVAVAVGGGSFPMSTNRADLVSPAGTLTVSMDDTTPHIGAPGQADVVLSELTIVNTASDEFSSPIVLSAVSFLFTADDLSHLLDPTSHFAGFRVRSAYQQHFAGVPLMADSLAVFDLTTPLLVPANATMSLELVATLADDCPLGTITPSLGGAGGIGAEDANDGSPIPVTILTDPQGPALDVLGHVSALSVVGTGLLPIQLGQGEQDVPILTLDLAHTDAVGVASVYCDSLILNFTNAQRQPINPSPYLSRIQISADDQILATVVDPTHEQGHVAVDLTDVAMAPQTTQSLSVLANFRSPCPTETFEVTVGRSDIVARESVTGTSVEIAAAAVIWPLSSGVTQVIVPAEELIVQSTSLMPPLLAPFSEPYAALRLGLHNPASTEGGNLYIDALTLAQGANKAAAPQIGQLLSGLEAIVVEEVVGSAADILSTDTDITVLFSPALMIPAGQTVDLDLRVIVRDAAPPGGLVLSLAQDGLVVRPPAGMSTEIRIQAAAGQTFPMLTETGNVSAASLDNSYINFPNPFAAGRESTTFAFALTGEALVTLRILTPHGEAVTTLLESEPLSAGLHQDDIWDGINGRGVTVRNGVYMAEIIVEYTDGTRERALRKVAVVR